MLLSTRIMVGVLDTVCQENASDYQFTKGSLLLVNGFRGFIPWLSTPLVLDLC